MIAFTFYYVNYYVYMLVLFSKFVYCHVVYFWVILALFISLKLFFVTYHNYLETCPIDWMSTIASERANKFQCSQKSTSKMIVHANIDSIWNCGCLINFVKFWPPALQTFDKFSMKLYCNTIDQALIKNNKV